MDKIIIRDEWPEFKIKEDISYSNKEWLYNWIGNIQRMFHIGQRPININEVVDCLVKNDKKLTVVPKEWMTDKVTIALQTMVRKKRNYWILIWDSPVSKIVDFVPNFNPNRSTKKSNYKSPSNLLPMSWARKAGLSKK